MATLRAAPETISKVFDVWSPRSGRGPQRQQVSGLEPPFDERFLQRQGGPDGGAVIAVLWHSDSCAIDAVTVVLKDLAFGCLVYDDLTAEQGEDEPGEAWAFRRLLMEPDWNRLGQTCLVLVKDLFARWCMGRQFPTATDHTHYGSPAAWYEHLVGQDGRTVTSYARPYTWLSNYAWRCGGCGFFALDGQERRGEMVADSRPACWFHDNHRPSKGPRSLQNRVQDMFEAQDVDESRPSRVTKCPGCKRPLQRQQVPLTEPAPIMVHGWWKLPDCTGLRQDIDFTYHDGQNNECRAIYRFRSMILFHHGEQHFVAIKKLEPGNANSRIRVFNGIAKPPVQDMSRANYEKEYSHWQWTMTFHVRHHPSGRGDNLGRPILVE